MTDSPRHSIKVPRLYKTACKIAQVVREEGGSLKELVYSGKHPNIKALYALVVQTLQHEKELNSIIENSKILEKEKRLDPWLARVLITELIWGKKRLSGESKPVKTVISYQSSFSVGEGGGNVAENQLKEVIKAQLPRYVRVNTLHLNVEEAVDFFRNEGWLLSRQADEDLFPSSDHFRVDAHIPDVLSFPPGTELYSHPLYKDRSILLQDKASCMAAHLLAPPPGSTVLDMCSAPGMKTTHLAARMKNMGVVYAVEKDPKRYKTLCSFVEEAGATCVKTILGDSVQLKPEEVPGVEYILVDPSCSGTGIVSRPKVGDQLDNPARLRNLVGFQRRLLLHAMTSFPKATRIIYSTCSLLPDENEGVVAWALSEMSEDPHQGTWSLKEDPLPGWSNRGCEQTYPGVGKHCLYSRPETDLTNGFFLAILERKKKEASNDHQEITTHMTKKKKKRKGCEKEEETEVVTIAGVAEEDSCGEFKEVEEEGGRGDDDVIASERTSKKKKKKKEKNKREEEEEEANEMEGDSRCISPGNPVDKSVMKKAKSEVAEDNGEEGRFGDQESTIRVKVKKKKKKRGQEERMENVEMEAKEVINNGEIVDEDKVKKRKKRDEEEVGGVNDEDGDGTNRVKKKKKQMKK
ncbi:28S rRNA (cytosine-C(5))-methyltransferase isoform X2 [Ischnura elegans]|uniref:28S rRNA (cytosine-C(5))-methyltransferase isoform X2 n=1 Tax=Ischnura elegans TaxID=197161 RepID=UPI001ED89369|nr:28S rRNA (cytosine-C(5))-methyltransferase isoform X2 [Ischnura elegans]